MTLKGLIRMAYGVRGYQISGGPGWLNSDPFDVETKADGNPEHAQVLLMLQTLLADRFQLKLHRESRRMAAYWLVVGKNGVKFPQATDAIVQPRFGPTRAEYAGTIAQLANFLADKLDYPVIDRTEMKGRYAVNLEWESESNTQESASIASALERELGLKLESHREQVETLVIESAAKPSEN